MIGGQSVPEGPPAAMHLDVLDLKSFYYRTPLGRVAQRAIRDQVLALWPDAHDQTVAGFGFAVPLLRPYLETARRVVALMPAPQGVMPWPAGLANVSALCEENAWPLATGSVERLVLLHGLETSERPTDVLEEAARVLAPGGRVLFIVPARSGLWARRDVTPFGFGRPYSAAQLEAQLKRHGFTPERTLSALFAPPSHSPFWLRTADTWERVGRRFGRFLRGGVVMTEATKQVWAPRAGGHGARVRRALPILSPAPAALPAPRTGREALAVQGRGSSAP